MCTSHLLQQDVGKWLGIHCRYLRKESARGYAVLGTLANIV